MRNGRLGFLVAGVQKAGTTALFSYLARHPDLSSPRKKEIHFFDNESNLDWARPDYHRLHQFFLAPKGDERIAFEATPISIFWPNALERIAAYNPDMRFILIFRDPIKRAWSHWRMETSRGRDNVPFEYAVREGRRRLSEVAINHPARRTFSYVERGFYGKQICNLFRIFDRDNVLLLRSDDLRREPIATLASIASFLRVGPFPFGDEIAGSIGHQDHAQPDDTDVDYLRGLYREDIELFTKVSKLKVDDWLTSGTQDGAFS